MKRSKLYIFAIGGSGARVLRAFVMLMGAGVRIEAGEIVPIVIDPDASNADLTRCVTLMNLYSGINATAGKRDEGFFAVPFAKATADYTLPVEDTADRSFRRFIELSSMSRSTRSMMEMLFSEKNLDSSMEVGFKGNPNIGSVVLNQIATSEEFEKICATFSEGDRIMIVSSIFGGTGASGFPLLLKTLRTGDGFPQHDLINKAVIGSLTLLPYFKVKPEENSEIDSATFMSKTKSALAYYEENIANAGSVDAMYTLGDETVPVYDNHEGGSAQRNNAHIIELLGATAIVDFAGRDCSAVSHLELGLKDINGPVSFQAMYKKLRQMLYRPMGAFTLMAAALLDETDYFTSGSFSANKEYFGDIYRTGFFSSLQSFMEQYRVWLEEMRTNRESLWLYDLAHGGKPFNMVRDVKPRRVASLLSDFSLYADRLNKSARAAKVGTQAGKLLEMYYKGGLRMMDEKLPI